MKLSPEVLIQIACAAAIAAFIYNPSLPTALGIITISGLLGFSLYLASTAFKRSDDLEKQIKALKERLDVMTIAQGARR